MSELIGELNAKIDNYEKIVRELQDKITYLERRNKEIYEGFIAMSSERCEYAVIVDKAIKKIEGYCNIKDLSGHVYTCYPNEMRELLKILRGR